MSYNDIAEMARNGDLRERIAACAAREGITNPHPTRWADDHQWAVVAKADWEAAWEYARNVGAIERLGHNEGVINDGMILSAVQGLIADQEA